VLVDAHVHHHPCFDTGVFYQHADHNFGAAEQQLGLGPSTVRCLLIAETPSERHFEVLVQGAGARGWRVQPTLDPAAVVLTRTGFSALT
jgi:hypothetical protein